jgi:hypothetical protein
MRRKFRSLGTFKVKINIAAFMLLINSCLYHTAFSQKNSYELKWNTDVALGTISLASLGSFYFFQQQVPPLTVSQVNSLNSSVVPAFDRVAINQYDITARKASNILIYATFITRAGIFYSKKTRSDLLKIGLVGYQSIFLGQAMVNGLKLAKRNRPYMYNPNVPMSLKTSRDSRFSFFSGHTTTVSTICFTTAFAYDIYYSESKLKPWYGLRLLLCQPWRVT